MNRVVCPFCRKAMVGYVSHDHHCPVCGWPLTVPSREHPGARRCLMLALPAHRAYVNAIAGPATTTPRGLS